MEVFRYVIEAKTVDVPEVKDGIAVLISQYHDNRFVVRPLRQGPGIPRKVICGLENLTHIRAMYRSIVNFRATNISRPQILHYPTIEEAKAIVTILNKTKGEHHVGNTSASVA